MNKYSLSLFEGIVKKYGLGEIQNTPGRIFGGLLHKMFKITTEKGSFAVKVLNPEIMKRKEAYNNFVFSETVVKAAENGNIRVISAINNNGNVVEKIAKEYIMVFPWQEGITLSTAPAGEKACYKIGKTLADIHNLSINSSNITPYGSMKCSKQYLEVLDTKFPNISDIIIQMQNKYNKRIELLNSGILVSHTDIDQKNVLWNAGNPIVIDWEAAGPLNPIVELLTACFYWGGIVDGEIDKDSFIAIIKGYSEVRTIDYTSIGKYIYGVVGFIDWLMYNVDCSIQNSSTEDLKQAEDEITKTVGIIKRFYNGLDEYLKWLEEFSKK